jgi:two-component system sensor histidine kinase PhoQ
MPSTDTPSRDAPAGRSVSLHRRLLLAGSVGLAAFLGLTGVVLDAAFRDSALSAVRDRLQGQIYTLLASAELTAGGGLAIPDALPEPRLSRPGSGLYASVFGERFVWRSDSALGLELPWRRELAPGQAEFDGPLAIDEGSVFRLSQGVAWEQSGDMFRFTFNVSEDTRAFHEQVRHFRHTLWFWLGGAALLLLVLQWMLLRWSLRPLRSVSRELEAVEEGRREGLSGDYPEELKGLTGHLNAFIRAEREHLQRYRNTLSDLAHSLKTPLAVLRSGLDSESLDADARDRLRQQLDRMDELVAHRLKRAAHAGTRTLGVRTPVAPVAEQVVAALDKVHAGRDVQCRLAVPGDAAFPGEEGDLYELLGNLLDNAYKWAGSAVGLNVQALDGGYRAGLVLDVTDDGPGIEPAQLERLLERGVRGDERADGHGIGLATVNDIVTAYGGDLSFEQRSGGGTLVRVTIPGR